MKSFSKRTSPDNWIMGTMCLVLTTSLVAASWSQYGGDQGNTHRSQQRGPGGSIGSTTEFLHPTTGTEISQGHSGTQVTCTANDDYIVTSYDNEVHVFDNTGTHQTYLSLSSYSVTAGMGTRAAPLFDNTNNLIYFGTESGSFFELQLTITAGTYALAVANVDTSIGVIESPATQTPDGSIYIAEQWGDIHRFSGNPLTWQASYTTGEVVTGAVATFECDATSVGNEIVVATRDGNLHVLSHDLSTNLWTNTDGYTAGDEYSAGVTIAGLRGSGSDPLALMSLSGASSGSYSGGVRAVNLTTGITEGVFEPSLSTIGSDEILGSVAILHPDSGNRWATVASSSGFVYGFDLLNVTNEMWNAPLIDPSILSIRPGYGTPAVGQRNAVYVISDTEDLHVFDGNSGGRIGIDTSFKSGSTGATGDAIIGNTRNLTVTLASGTHILYP
jgi:hypothetical protein